ncbi:MAG: hypothetical protein WEE89_11420 [Gemmatimonadota bacterium]
MGKLWSGSALLVVSLVMLAGAFGASRDTSVAAMIGALAIAVLLPGMTGAALIAAHFRGKGRLADRKQDLRQQTLEAEALLLAGKHGGKLTIVEMVGTLAVTPEDAKNALDALARRGFADFEVTESGVIVYAFHDLQKLSEKPQSKNILE